MGQLHGLSVKLDCYHDYACSCCNFRMLSWSMIPAKHCFDTDLPSLDLVSIIDGWLVEQGKERSHITILRLQIAFHQGLTFTGAQMEFTLTIASSPHSNLVLRSLLHITDPTPEVSTLLRYISTWEVEASGTSRQRTELHKTEFSDGRSVPEQREIQDSHPS